MILVRDIFRLKFGKAKEAKDLFKDAKKIAAGIGFNFGKTMTDITGPSYTLVMETEFESLSDFENKIRTVFSNSEWQKWYQKFSPLVESASREMYTVIE
ncbi:MAG: hypothetical protein JNJ56_12380 [Ignavibacteria bacterium]|nr:hypothetical protein [Ignavibacteria bacterium]